MNSYPKRCCPGISSVPKRCCPGNAFRAPFGSVGYSARRSLVSCASEAKLPRPTPAVATATAVTIMRKAIVLPFQMLLCTRETLTRYVRGCRGAHKKAVAATLQAQPTQKRTGAADSESVASSPPCACTTSLDMPIRRGTSEHRTLHKPLFMRVSRDRQRLEWSAMHPRAKLAQFRCSGTG